MAATINGSFSSPIADAQYPLGAAISDGGLLSQLYNGMNFMSVTVSLLLVLVAYDQRELSLPGRAQLTMAKKYDSHVHLEQRHNHRSIMEDAIHGAIPPICQP